VGCTLTLGWAAGCTLSWPAEKGGPESCPFLPHALFHNSLDRLFVQPALLSSVQPTSPPKVHVFHLETRPSRLPGLPISVILFHVWGKRILSCNDYNILPSLFFPQLFSTPVTSSNLCKQAPLITELRLL